MRRSHCPMPAKTRVASSSCPGPCSVRLHHQTTGTIGLSAPFQAATDGNETLLGPAGQSSHVRHNAPLPAQQHHDSGSRADVAWRSGHARASRPWCSSASPCRRLGELLKPFVTEAIFLLLCISFMRVDIGALRDHLRRPGIVLPQRRGRRSACPDRRPVGLATGLDTRSPDLFLALMLQSVASPMMAAPALAALMGLDSTLVLITLVTSTALVPITAPAVRLRFLRHRADALPAGPWPEAACDPGRRRCWSPPAFAGRSAHPSSSGISARSTG